MTKRSTARLLRDRGITDDHQKRLMGLQLHIEPLVKKVQLLEGIVETELKRLEQFEQAATKGAIDSDAASELMLRAQDGLAVAQFELVRAMTEFALGEDDQTTEVAAV